MKRWLISAGDARSFRWMKPSIGGLWYLVVTILLGMEFGHVPGSSVCDLLISCFEDKQACIRGHNRGLQKGDELKKLVCIIRFELFVDGRGYPQKMAPTGGHRDFPRQPGASEGWHRASSQC